MIVISSAYSHSYQFRLGPLGNLIVLNLAKSSHVSLVDLNNYELFVRPFSFSFLFTLILESTKKGFRKNFENVTYFQPGTYGDGVIQINQSTNQLPLVTYLGSMNLD